MEYKVVNSEGRLNCEKQYYPLELVAFFNPAKNYTIKARTFTTHGCKISLLDRTNDEIFTGEYTYMVCEPNFHKEMAADVAENINIVFELENRIERLNASELEKIMLEVLQKCESLQGGVLQKFDYDAIVVFQ